MDPGTIELTVERSTLTVQAQRQAAFPAGEQVLVAERPQGSFTRQLVLGEGVDAQGVSADYTNGVLHLTIPVKQSSQPRRIEVGQGGQPSRVVDVTDGRAGEGESAADGGGGPVDAGTSPS